MLPYLDVFVLGQEEEHPCRRRGRRVLTRQQQTNQHASDLIIIQVTTRPVTFNTQLVFYVFNFFSALKKVLCIHTTTQHFDWNGQIPMLKCQAVSRVTKHEVKSSRTHDWWSSYMLITFITADWSRKMTDCNKIQLKFHITKVMDISTWYC